jgi:2-dehydro-3-deoxygalactonokinase
VLRNVIADWNDALVVMSGMIGSRMGWREVPYVPCPAQLDALAAGMIKLPTDAIAGRTIWIVPGVMAETSDGRKDVMRGEETQVFGLSAPSDTTTQWLCLPGTHSKLVRVENDAIQELSTAMTGELFALLRQHGTLAPLLSDGHCEESFQRGCNDAWEPGGLLHHLFAVRTMGIFGEMDAGQLTSYLSGLLIAHELGHLPKNVTSVGLVANDELVRAYSTALHLRGIAPEIHGARTAATGAWRLASQRRLLLCEHHACA